VIYILIDVKKPPLFPGKSKFRKNTWQSLTTSASGEKVKIKLEHCRSALNSGKKSSLENIRVCIAGQQEDKVLPN
jgi:hypothetical protein